MKDKVTYKYFTFGDGTLIREYSYDKIKIYKYAIGRDKIGLIGDWIPLPSYMRFHELYLNKKELTIEEGESYMNKIKLVHKLVR